VCRVKNRKIERLLGISNVTVLYWVRELGRELSLQKICNKKVEMLELDELATYVKKNKIDIGCGLQLREMPKRYWGHMLETVQD
jgi:hypothetical protein